MAEYDLTRVVSQYFDLHLVVPLLEFMATRQIYDEMEIHRFRIKLLDKTNMLDYTIDIYNSLLPHMLESVRDDLMTKRERVVQEFEEMKKKVDPIIQAINEPSTKEYMNNCRDGKQLLDYIVNNHPGVTYDMLDDVYAFAKHNFNCGNYALASDILVLHRLLITPSDKNYLNNLWGKLASNILGQKWIMGLSDLNQLKDYIDSNNFSNPLQALQQRTWLIHWSLYVFFNHAQGRDTIIDYFLLQPPYLNAIQTMCPHILRYLATAVICNKGKGDQVRSHLIRVIQQESYQYSDPITEFIECLYVNYDFDGAQKKLRLCEAVLQNDFFLTACLEDFRENARLAIFETFCRIHECVSINMLAERLNMKKDEAEIWIVNLIRNARLNAKIDYKLGHVVMGQHVNDPYQALIDKTNNLTLRTGMLAQNVQHKCTINNPERGMQWSAV